MSPRASAGAGDARGQTLPDFAVGVALFLLAIVFVLVFVPQMMLPYEAQERPVVADRVTSDLTGTMLAEPASASRLNETCTLAFLNDSSDAGCPFDASNPVHEQLGIAASYNVNVTLRTNASDATASRVCNDDFADCQSGTEPLAVGPALPRDTDAVSIARHGVTVGDTRAVLEVGVW